MENNKNYFTTSDGVRLFYSISGNGNPLIMLSGYGQDLTGFSRNIEELAKYFKVCIFDYRAHGLSDAPDYGYHIERFAKDLYDFIEYLAIDKFYLLAHSMGNAVVWSYLSLFGQDKIIKYVLEDEAPCMICDPEWTDEEKEMYTGLFHGKDIWEKFGEMKAVEPTMKNRMLLHLLRDHLGRDWRDIIPTITVPTMVLMGGKSHFASSLLWNWLNTNIRDSKLEIISAEENGTHDMHVSNSEKFNILVIDFFLDDIHSYV